MKIKIKEKPQDKEVKKIFDECVTEETETPETEEKPREEEEVVKKKFIFDKKPKNVGEAITEVGKNTRVPTIGDVVKTALDDLSNTQVKKVDIEDQTEKMIEKVNQSAVIHTIRTNEEVQKIVLDSAEEQVRSELEIKRNQQMVKVVKATYNANKDACENLGLDDEGRPMWQIRIAKLINNFWFIIWAIISSITITPVIFFLKRIGTQVKSIKVTWILSILFYVIIITGIVFGILALTGALGG